MFSVKRTALVIVITLFVAGCPVVEKDTIAPLVSDKKVSKDAHEQFEEAVLAFDAKSFEDANGLFSHFIADNSETSMALQAKIYQARISIEEAKFADAIVVLENIIETGGESVVADYAKLYLGLAWYKEKKYSKSIDLLSGYEGRFLDGEDNGKVFSILWKSYVALQDLEGMVLLGERYLKINNDDKTESEIFSELEFVLAQSTKSDKLTKIASKLNEKDRVWAFVVGRAATIAYDEGDIHYATRLVLEIKDSPVSDYSFLGDLYQVLLNLNSVDMRTVGVLLPLSGSMRMVGHEALKGVMLGSKKIRFGNEGSPLSLVIKDTGVEGSDIALMVKEIVEKDKVSAIIGPIDGKNASIAATQAQKLGVPLVALTTYDSVVKKGEFVFKKFASNALEVHSLLTYAKSTSTQAARVAVLYPQSPYGKQMLDLFEKLKIEYGVLSAGAVSFDPATQDFTQVINKVKSLEFDSIFMPVTANQAALIAPYLARVGIWPTGSGADTSVGNSKKRGVNYLFSSVSNLTAVFERAGKYLQGAIFVTGFDKTHNSVSASFGRAFENEYKKEATVFSVYSYDAIILIADAVKSGVGSRVELCDWLSKIKDSNLLILPFSGFDDDGSSLAIPLVGKLSGTKVEVVR